MGTFKPSNELKYGMLGGLGFLVLIVIFLLLGWRFCFRYNAKKKNQNTWVMELADVGQHQKQQKPTHNEAPAQKLGNLYF